MARSTASVSADCASWRTCSKKLKKSRSFIVSVLHSIITQSHAQTHATIPKHNRLQSQNSRVKLLTRATVRARTRVKARAFLFIN